MKKIFLLFCAAAVLTGCASVQESFFGYSEKKYQAKVEEYKKEIPAGYSFAVEKEPPYKLKKYYFRIEQVLDKDSVIACYAYSWAYSYNQYRIGKCADDERVRIVFEGPHKELYDNDNFWITYYKNGEPFIYTDVLGGQRKIRTIFCREE